MNGKMEPERLLALEARDKVNIILDVGGERFIANRRIIERFPASRLGRLVRAENLRSILELCDEFTPGETPEYFFDRNPENFSSILNMYR